MSISRSPAPRLPSGRFAGTASPEPALSDVTAPAAVAAQGAVVWARVASWPWWPCVVVPYARTLFMPRGVARPAARAHTVTVQLFADGKVAQLAPEQVLPFEGHGDLAGAGGPRSARIRRAYDAARAWVWSFGPVRTLPYMPAGARLPAPLKILEQQAEEAGAPGRAAEEDVLREISDHERTLRRARHKLALIAAEKQDLCKEIAEIRARHAAERCREGAYRARKRRRIGMQDGERPQLASAPPGA